MQLTTPLNFNKDVSPLKIQKQNEATADGTKAVVAGWGVTDVIFYYIYIKAQIKIKILSFKYQV